MKQYEYIGLSSFINNEEWVNKLKSFVLTNYKSIVPGYEYDYKLFGFNDFLEFTYGQSLDGMPYSFDMHFSANHHWTLDYVTSSAKEDGIFFDFKLPDSDETISIKMICSDVLAGPEPGDSVYGQVVAYADPLSFVYSSNTESYVKPCGNHVNISGEIVDVHKRCFVFSEAKIAFWELDIDTPLGIVTVLTSDKAFHEVPEVEQYISFQCLVCMDVAVTLWNRIDRRMPHHNAYTHILNDAVGEYRNGFVPNHFNNRKLIKLAFEHGNLTRLSRCCTANITTNYSDNGNLFVVPKTQILNELNKICIPNRTVELTLITESITGTYLGAECVCISEAGIARKLVVFQENQYGLIDSIHILDATKYLVGYDPDLHNLYTLGCAMCNGYLFPLSEAIAPDCMYRSEYGGKRMMGSRQILSHFETIWENLNEANKYTFEIVEASHELCETTDLPEIIQSKWCIKEYQSTDKHLAAIIFVESDEDGFISKILLSRSNYLKDFQENHATEEDSESSYTTQEIIMGKEITVQYPFENYKDLCLRFTAAYNTRNIDILKTLFDQHIVLDDYSSSGYIMNNGIYSLFTYNYKRFGKMKLAYVRRNKNFYSIVSYIENWGYYTFSVNQEGKINLLFLEPLDKSYRSLLVTEHTPTYHAADDVPALHSVEFMNPSANSRYSVRMEFSNGEKRQYDFKGEFGTEEVTKMEGLSFTDKMFKHGKIVDSIVSIEDTNIFEAYAPRGQGLQFINGYCISSIELYHGSYLIDSI